MTQRYSHPTALARMDSLRCPECGDAAEEHSSSPNFWERGFASCDLLPRGVTDRIAAYLADKDERR